MLHALFLTQLAEQVHLITTQSSTRPYSQWPYPKTLRRSITLLRLCIEALTLIPVSTVYSFQLVRRTHFS